MNHLRQNCQQGGGIRWPGLWLIVVSALLLATSGCGRKGPPVAPRLQVPVAVTDLGAKVDGGTVVLSWRVPPESEAHLPDGYRVYRAKLTVEDCEGCPLLFQRLGEVALHKGARPAAGGPWTLTWRDEVAVGFRYIYKVSAYGGGHKAVDSNLVNVRP